MLWLFAVTAFLGAALAFLVEPLVAKMLLPTFGGTSAVWTTALVFFQGSLLVGYAWAHLTLTVLGVRRHTVLQVAVVLLPLIALPIVVPSDGAPPDGVPIAVWLVGILGAMVGLPFVVLSTTGPTIQRWYAATAQPGAREPYRLFAASNAGSLVGLLAYPTLVEPYLDLADQARWWAVAFVAFAGLTATGAIALRRSMSGDAMALRDRDGRDVDEGSAAPEPIVGSRRIRWLLLAGVPAALLVGVTSHLSTDVAAVPLLWVVPLSIYLVTLILAYARRSPIGLRASSILLPPAALLSALTVLDVIHRPVELVFAIHLGTLLVAGLALHGRLAADRPHPRRLTEYTLVVALGGAIGGLAAGVLGPLLLPWPLEAQIALVAALLLVPRSTPRLPALAPALGVAVLLVAAHVVRPAALHEVRTFYGIYRVVETEPGRHVLYAGTTIHGMQDRRPGYDREPRSYYHRGGPLGEVLTAVLREPRPISIGGVGLGTGAIAAYGRPGDRIEFFEIDPAVVEIARNPRLFTFIEDSPSIVEIHVADGRIGLERTPHGAYDVLVLDAFSSDAVPVHLLTVEAIGLAMDRVRPGGVLAVHVSNRYLDLEVVVGAAARDLGLVAITGSNIPPRDGIGVADASQWVIVGASYADLADLAAGPDWRSTRHDGRSAWTDRASDLLGVLVGG